MTQSTPSFTLLRFRQHAPASAVPPPPPPAPTAAGGGADNAAPPAPAAGGGGGAVPGVDVGDAPPPGKGAWRLSLSLCNVRLHHTHTHPPRYMGTEKTLDSKPMCVCVCVDC